MRLIDVDELGVGRCSRDVLPAAYCAGWNGLLGLIEKAPTVDAVPVVHGQWVTHYRSGTTVAEGYVSTCCDMWNNRKSDYCPNCGARMDGGADHEAD